MNSSQPNEDLFESSRMSFGDHLEELRKVLIRSAIGVGIFSLVGFYFASPIIQILKQPLVDAIALYNIEDTSKELEEKYGFVPPEYLPLMKKDGKIPRLVQFDPVKMRKALGLKEDAYVEDFGFKPSHFDVSNLKAIGERLSTQTGDWSVSEARLKAAWENISAEDQKVISGIADGDKSGESALAQVVEIFNRLSQVEKLSDSEAFEDDLTEGRSGFWEMFSAAKPKPLAKMKEKLHELAEAGHPDSKLSRRLNRSLITSLFYDLMPAPQVELAEFEIWEDSDFQPQALGVGEGFSVWLKAGLFTGLTIAGPWVFFQLWTFVATGLYPQEKKYAHVFLPISIFLFVSGVLLAFFFVFQPVLGFLFSFNRQMGIAPQMRINDWLSFVMFLPLGFGIAFQLPLVMLFMNRIGLFSVQDYMSKWRVAVMIIFVLAMFLTPADPISMLLLAVPLTFLYFLGVGMCKWMPGTKNPFGDDAALPAT